MSHTPRIIAGIEMVAPLEPRLLEVTRTWEILINGQLAPKYSPPVALMVASMCATPDELIKIDDLGERMRDFYRNERLYGTAPIVKRGWHKSNNPSKPFLPRKLQQAVSNLEDPSKGLVSTNFYRIPSGTNKTCAAFAMLCSDATNPDVYERAVKSAGVSEAETERIVGYLNSAFERKRKEDLGLVPITNNGRLSGTVYETKKKPVPFDAPISCVNDCSQFANSNEVDSALKRTVRRFVQDMFIGDDIDELFGEAKSLLNICFLRYADILSGTWRVSMREIIDSMHERLGSNVSKIDLERLIVADFAKLAKVHMVKGQETPLGKRIDIEIDRSESDPLCATLIRFR